MICNYSMRKILKNLLIIMGAVILWNCGIVEGARRKPMITKTEAVTIANKEATRLGYNLNRIESSADAENSVWTHYLRQGVLRLRHLNLERKLASKRFWAIYYAPRQSQFGGDLFVFVDKENGDVIDHLKGQ